MISVHGERSHCTSRLDTAKNSAEQRQGAQKGFKGKQWNDGVSVYRKQLSIMQGVTKPAQNWLSENLGDGFSAESEVMDQVETSRGSREGGRREDVSAQGTAQVMKKDNIVLCFSKPSLHANFNSLRHFLPCYPQQQNIYGLNIFKSSVFPFL